MGLILPHTTIHLAGNLIDYKTGLLIGEKVRIAKEKNLSFAPLADLIGGLTDYNLIRTEKNCGGYYNQHGKEIAIKKYPDGHTVAVNATLEEIHLSLYSRKTACHEIGHHIQAELGIFDKIELTLSEMLRIEHQAESIAYKLYNSIFENLPHYWFDSYFTKEGVEFLNNWHKDYIQNDLAL